MLNYRKIIILTKPKKQNTFLSIRKICKNKFSKPAIGNCFSVIFIAAMGKIHAGNVHPSVNHIDQVVGGL